MPAFDYEIFRIFWTMSEMNKALNTLACAGLIGILLTALSGCAVLPRDSKAQRASNVVARGAALFEIRVHLLELDQNLASAYNNYRLLSAKDMRVTKDMCADLLSRADVKLIDKAIIAAGDNERETYMKVCEVIYPEEVDAMGKAPDDVRWITKNVGSTISVMPAYDEQSDCVSLQFDAEYVDEPEWVNGLPWFKVSSVCTKIVLCLDDSVCMLPSGGIYRDETGIERTKVYFVEVRRLNSVPQSPDSDGVV